MGVREDTVTMLQSGKTPGEITRLREVTLATTLNYLDQKVGQGAIRRSDILFSIPRERRNPILRVLQDGGSRSMQAVQGRLNRRGFSFPEEDIDVVLKYGDAGHASGDMYDDLRTIEKWLHSVIRQALESEYGAGESGWWRKGIHKNIRGKCATRREEDDGEPAPHSYAYTDLIDLREVLDKQWRTISEHLPKGAAKDKKSLLAALIRLNEIRRIVMHPVRGGVPSEDDFEFLRDLKAQLTYTSKSPIA